MQHGMVLIFTKSTIVTDQSILAGSLGMAATLAGAIALTTEMWYNCNWP